FTTYRPTDQLVEPKTIPVTRFGLFRESPRCIGVPCEDPSAVCVFKVVILGSVTVLFYPYTTGNLVSPHYFPEAFFLKFRSDIDYLTLVSNKSLIKVGLQF